MITLPKINTTETNTKVSSLLEECSKKKRVLNINKIKKEIRKVELDQTTIYDC